MSHKIRKKVKYNSPNRLFEQWLTEWRDEAAAKGKRSHHTYARALKSLKKYPLPLSSGKEAKILQHFGDKICAMLDEKLQEHKLLSSEKISETELTTRGESCEPTVVSGVEKCLPPDSTIRNAVSKNFTPVFKNSSTIPSSVFLPIIVQKDLPPREIQNDIDASKSSICLLPDTHEVVLCVDNCETLSSHSANHKVFLSELKKSEIQFEIRKLHVGDFLWVARTKGSSNPQEELVMDFIVERKRLDDLASSIKDGRFREQKFRLKNCGLRYPIYLVEYHRSHQYSGLPESTLEQAIVNTQIVDGFIIRRTQNTKESVTYLSSVTKFLQKSLQMQTLTNSSRQTGGYQTFQEFNQSSIKNKHFSVQEMFAKQLLQLHGLSVDKASAFINVYPTPAKMFEMLNGCKSETEQQKRLSEIKFGKSQRNIGSALGRHLHQLYTTPGPLS